MRLCYLLVIFVTVSARFFDVCPGRRQSIGACLVGLCPAGSECINSYCCKNKKLNSGDSLDIDNESDETLENHACPNGGVSIGECVSNACPLDYHCVAGLCCDSRSVGLKKWSLKSKKEEEIPMKSSPISLITVAPDESSEMEAKQKLEGIKEETGESNTTSAPDKEIVDEEDSELEEEEDQSTTTSTTTTTTTTTTVPSVTSSALKRKQKRVKAKKPRTSTRTPTTATTTNAPTTTVEEIDSTTEEEVTELETQAPITEEVTEPHFVCPVGAPIGECIANKCPEGHGCVEGQCCILTPQINCTDTLTGCLSHLCDRKGYRQFMTNNCPKTCARCHLVNILPTEIQDCRDRRSDCGEWAAEGFCESSLYTTRQKLKFCGKSCKLCGV